MEWDEQDGLDGHELRDADTFPASGSPGEGRRTRIWIVALVVLAVAGALGYLLLWDDDRRPETETAETSRAATERLDPGAERVGEEESEKGAPSAEEEPAIDPAVLESAEARNRHLRSRLRELAGEEVPPSLLVGEDLTRRAVAAIDAIARGGAVAPLFPAVRPERPFEVVRRDGEIYPAPTNHERYDRWVEFLSSIDPAGAARAFQQLEPLLEVGYRELGYPEEDLEGVVRSALDRLLATPIPESPPRLVPAGARGWAYADPGLEGLAPAQKQLLRMGPENQRRVLSWLERFDAAL